MRYLSNQFEETADQPLPEDMDCLEYEIQAYCEADREYLPRSRSKCYSTHHEHVDEMGAISEYWYDEPDPDELGAFWHGEEESL